MYRLSFRKFYLGSCADVQLVTYVPPPSETNYSAAFLTGSQAACKAACNAFTDAVLEIARNPIQRA